ncbi:MAG: hypothetical protein IKX23_08030 [Treponema sp.]|nr:hypothetical protein [Treponema sp.]
MKSIKKTLLTSLLILSSLAALCAKPKPPLRVGNIPEGTPDEKLATVTFNRFIVVVSIDGVFNKEESETYKAKKDPEGTPYLDKSLALFNTSRTILIKPGKHTVAVRYQTDAFYTKNPNTLELKFEAGKSYTLLPFPRGNSVYFELHDGESGDQMSTADNKTFQQKAVEEYKKSVHDEAQKGTTTFILQNKSIVIEYGKNGTVKYVENGVEHKGYLSFTASKDSKKGTLTIKFNDDGKLTRAAFLKLNPEDCDRVFEILGFAKTKYLGFTMQQVVPKGKKVVFEIYTRK